jgi:hypothetical protein
MNEMECVQTTKWYCMQCRDFLPIKQFKAGPKRWICRRHYNEKWHKVKMERWNKNPQQKRCNIMWQIAYKDSIIVFLLKIEITPAQVLILLQDHSIPMNTGVRLLPLDPKKPLSLDNYCLTSLDIRKVMCRVWKRFHCTSEYESALAHYQMEWFSAFQINTEHISCQDNQGPWHQNRPSPCQCANERRLGQRRVYRQGVLL